MYLLRSREVRKSLATSRLSIFQAIDELNSVDLFNFVYRMRKSRALMVQNKEQYAFIYKCLKIIAERQRNSTYMRSSCIYDDTDNYHEMLI